jgi:hypothetical protein
VVRTTFAVAVALVLEMCIIARASADFLWSDIDLCLGLASLLRY